MLCYILCFFEYDMFVFCGVVFCFVKFKGLCLFVCKGYKIFGLEDEIDV